MRINPKPQSSLVSVIMCQTIPHHVLMPPANYSISLLTLQSSVLLPVLHPHIFPFFDVQHGSRQSPNVTLISSNCKAVSITLVATCSSRLLNCRNHHLKLQLTFSLLLHLDHFIAYYLHPEKLSL